MAQHSDPEDYIDVDGTLLKPSPNRIRNILTLDERVAAIQAYYCRPMYTKVARMFNCSWEQIKNIIANREAIMEFYEATKKQEKQQGQQRGHHAIDGGDLYDGMDLKQRKLKFLGECIYEYIQRVQFHARQDITEELLRMKALEFRDIMDINDFYPNKHWINQFKAVYNISLANRQITLTRVPPSSLDLKDIMTYCSKNKLCSNPSLVEIRELQQNRQQTQQAAGLLSTDSTIEDLEERRRVRKLNFLEKALAEYVHRAKFHHKSIHLNNEILIRIARELNDILKVHQFVPSHNWVQEFKMRQNVQNGHQENLHRRPPLSLDLKDILSYCSRMDNKEKAPTITLTPKHPTIHVRQRILTPPSVNLKFPNSSVKFKNDSIIYLDEDEEEDIKPDIEEIKVQPLTTAAPISEMLQPPLPPSPPIKIRRIESINADSTIELVTKIKQENDSDNESIKSCGTFKSRSDNNNGYRPEPYNTVIAQPPKQKRVLRIIDGEDHKELPQQVRNIKDALRLLKPIEEYAMLKENYRAIGLIAQLEEILKDIPNETNGKT